jgi:hypothetical protein
VTDKDFVDIVTLLRSPDRFEPYTCNAAADEIERLRDERDEARREVCRHEADGADCEREYAAMRGWDCFPEAEPH